MAKYIVKQQSNKDLVAENTALKQQLDSLRQNSSSVNPNSKFGKIIDSVTITHSTPTKAGNGVMLHFKGSLKNYSVFLKQAQLPKVKFGSIVNVREYKKDGKTVSSAVIMVSQGIRKWTSLPKQVASTPAK